MKSRTEKDIATIYFLTMVLAAATACGDATTTPGYLSRIPTLPKPMPGQAMLSGKVLDDKGAPIASAQIQIAETDAVTAAGSDGVYALMVPSETTLSLVVTAEGHAKTLVEAVKLTSMATVPDFNVVMLTPAKIDAYNTMARETAMGYGVVALAVSAPAGGCDPKGALLALEPASTGKVMYARPEGFYGEPDLTLTSVVRDTGINAWLAGVIPPGTSYEWSASKDGCTATTMPATVGSITYTGQRKVEAGALTQVSLFVN